METEILKIKGDWQEVVDDCRVTVDKPPLGKEPSAEFKRKMMIAEHDPIRDIEVKWKWNLPYWVAMHWKTHIWRSRTTTQRNDRQEKYNRENAPQGVPVAFIGDANTQHLIDTMRKRLCRMASPETRRCAESLKLALKDIEPEIADALVPNCVYRCGCPEPTACGYFRTLQLHVKNINAADIQARYDAYNDMFYSVKGREEYERFD